jgi:hypothetical protein
MLWLWFKIILHWIFRNIFSWTQITTSILRNLPYPFYQTIGNSSTREQKISREKKQNLWDNIKRQSDEIFRSWYLTHQRKFRDPFFRGLEGSGRKTSILYSFNILELYFLSTRIWVRHHSLWIRRQGWSPQIRATASTATDTLIWSSGRPILRIRTNRI